MPTTTTSTIALHKLPVQLRMLVRLMGEAAAYRLVQDRGGTPFTVPKGGQSRQFAGLVDAVGVEAASALVAEMSGVTLQLPKYDGVLRQLRHQRVIELRMQGTPLAEIALATGYTVRQVINVLNAARLPDGTLPPDPAANRAQGDLFGNEDEPEPARATPAAASSRLRNPSQAV